MGADAVPGEGFVGLAEAEELEGALGAAAGGYVAAGCEMMC